MRPPRRHSRQSGFTLAELAILLAVLSIIIGSLMLQMVTGSAIGAQETTLKRMQAIEQAVMAYWLVNNRIPCPAAGSAALDDADFGAESGTPGDCTDGAAAGALYGPISATCNNWNTNCATGCTSNCGAVMGVVPVRRLNLPDEYALDGWSRRITYIVDERYTVSQSIEPDPALIVTDSHSAPAATNELGRYPLLMISHGRHGDRAFPANGSTVSNRPNTLTLNNTELHNVTDNPFNNRFVLQPFRPDLASASGRFDQLVRPVSLP